MDMVYSLLISPQNSFNGQENDHRMVLKSGQSSFLLEFRRIEDEELADDGGELAF